MCFQNVKTFESTLFLAKLLVVKNENLNKMNTLKNTILPILLATVWISISEFVRNEFLLKSYWTDHYESMGWFFRQNLSMEPFGEFGRCALP
jgi:hypothetical protein